MKKLMIVLFLLLSGCTSTIELDVTQDAGVVPKYDNNEPLQYFDESIFSEDLLAEDNKPAWFKTYQFDHSYLSSPNSYESLESKSYVILTPNGSNSFDVRSYMVDHSVGLFDENPWYVRPSEFPKKHESENENDYIKNIVFKQLPNTPFFIIDEANSGDYGFQTANTMRYYNDDPILQSTGSTVLVEDKFLNRYSRLFFPADNGDIRSINLAALIEFFEFGSPSYESQSEISFREEAFKIRDSQFLNKTVGAYLDEKYKTEVYQIYLDLNSFRSYIYKNLDKVDSLKSLSDMDFLWLTFRSKDLINDLDPRNYNSTYNFEKISEDQDIEKLLTKMHDFIQLIE